MHVDADQVDQRAGTHRPAGAARHGPVHLRGLDPRLVEHANAVVQQRNQDAVDDEARRVVARHGLLACPFSPGIGGLDRFVGGLTRAHDLHQRKDRRGIEEVHAEDALRVLRRFRDLGHGEGRRVRGQDRIRPSQAVQLAEHLALEVELLQHGLDHEVAVGEIRELGRQAQPGQRRVPLSLRQAAFLDTTGEIALDRRASPLTELGAHLVSDRLETSLNADLRDSGAHRAEADHAHLADLHGGRS